MPFQEIEPTVIAAGFFICSYFLNLTVLNPLTQWNSQMMKGSGG